MLDNYERLAAVIAATGDIAPERLQRLVFVLQALGAPLSYMYQMNFERPYSEDLESDLTLLVSQGLLESERDRRGEVLRVGPTKATAAFLERGEDVRRYSKAIEELQKADPRILNFAATFGAWRELRYEVPTALKRTREAVEEKTQREVAVEGERLLERLGLLTGR